MAQSATLRFTTNDSIPMGITRRKPHSFAVRQPRNWRSCNFAALYTLMNREESR